MASNNLWLPGMLSKGHKHRRPLIPYSEQSTDIGPGPLADTKEIKYNPYFVNLGVISSMKGLEFGFDCYDIGEEWREKACT